ncbi:alpha/beta hydrolase [Actinocorallia longicatena]|uniref:Alpha/beta hydrolase n=1 Tax=Actinocorallia longicatena TaxID=111803 RepID=A0ABP6Q2W9_9ACTN
MRIPYLKRALTAVAVATTLIAGSVSAQAGPSGTGGAKPTVVLVHGAFADASGFDGTIALLQRAGFPTIAPANPLRDTAADAAYISSVLDTITGPVILAAHSYGGVVITNAARGHANVKALVYLGAFAPDQGESALQLATSVPGSLLGPALIARPWTLPDGSQGTDGYVDPAKFRQVFAADLPESKTRLMAATQRPGNFDGLSGLSGVPAWKSIPSWYLIPTEDKVIPPAVQRSMAERAGSHTREISSSHVVMISHPAAATATILAAYAATR